MNMSCLVTKALPIHLVWDQTAMCDVTWYLLIYLINFHPLLFHVSDDFNDAGKKFNFIKVLETSIVERN